MRVLFTAIGTASNSYLILHSRKNYDWYIVGTDINPPKSIASSIYIDSFYQVKSINDINTYIDQLIEICIIESIDLLFPVIDEEVEEIARRLDDFHKIGVKPLTSSLESIEFVRNKKKLSEFIEKHYKELYIKTFNYSEFDNSISYPLFLKPKAGRASINTFKVESDKDLKNFKVLNNESPLIIQEFIDGEVFSVDCFINLNLDFAFSIVRKELLRNCNGAAISCEIIRIPYLEEVSLRIANELGLTGICNFEYFKLSDGSFRLIEINPRVPAGIRFSIMAGFDYLEMIIDYIGNTNKYNPEIEFDLTFSSYYNIVRTS